MSANATAVTLTRRLRNPKEQIDAAKEVTAFVWPIRRGIEDFRDKRIDGNIAFRQAGGVDALGVVLKGVVSEDEARSYAAKGVAHLAGEYVNEITAPVREAIAKAELATAIVQTLRKDSKRVASGRSSNTELNVNCKMALANLLGPADLENTSIAVRAGVIELLVVELSQPDSIAHLLTASALFSLASVEELHPQLLESNVLSAAQRVLNSPTYRNGTKLLCSLTVAILRGWCENDSEAQQLISHPDAPVIPHLPKAVASCIETSTYLGISWDLQGFAMAYRSLLLNPTFRPQLTRGIETSEALFTIAKGKGPEGVVSFRAQREALVAFHALASDSATYKKLTSNVRLADLLREFSSVPSERPKQLTQAAIDLRMALENPDRAPAAAARQSPPDVLVICYPAPLYRFASDLQRQLAESGIPTHLPPLHGSTPGPLGADDGLVTVALVSQALLLCPASRAFISRSLSSGRPVIGIQVDRTFSPSDWLLELQSSSSYFYLPDLVQDPNAAAAVVESKLGEIDTASLASSWENSQSNKGSKGAPRHEVEPEESAEDPPPHAKESEATKSWKALVNGKGERLDELQSQLGEMKAQMADLRQQLVDLCVWRREVTSQIASLFSAQQIRESSSPSPHPLTNVPIPEAKIWDLHDDTNETEDPNQHQSDQTGGVTKNSESSQTEESEVEVGVEMVSGTGEAFNPPAAHVHDSVEIIVADGEPATEVKSE